VKSRHCVLSCAAWRRLFETRDLGSKDWNGDAFGEVGDEGKAPGHMLATMSFEDDGFEK